MAVKTNLAAIAAGLAARKTQILESAASVAVAAAIDYIPIFTGALRRSQKLQVVGDKVVVSYNKDYAAAQYYTGKSGKPLRHVFSSGKPQPIQNAVSASAARAQTRRAKKLGQKLGKAGRYGRLYRAADKAGALTAYYPDGLRWLERALAEPGVMARVMAVLKNG